MRFVVFVSISLLLSLTRHHDGITALNLPVTTSLPKNNARMSSTCDGKGHSFFTTPPQIPRPQDHCSTMAALSRSKFLHAALPAAIVATITILQQPLTATAKETSSSIKGTKNDPEFQACLSKCMYECTKPKGAEQQSRSECLPQCKKSCATTDEQRMTGTPLKK